MTVKFDKPRMQERIIEWIAQGKTLRAFCRQADAPGWRTVYDWLRDDPVFASAFAEARQIGFDAIAQECLDIADTPALGKRTEATNDGDYKVVEEDAIAHRKLQVWTRLQLLAKWDPKRFGDKVQVGGAADLPPIQANMTDDERANRIQQLLEAARARLGRN